MTQDVTSLFQPGVDTGRLAEALRSRVDTSGWDHSGRALSLMSNTARVVVDLRDRIGFVPDAAFVDRLLDAEALLALRFGATVRWYPAVSSGGAAVGVLPANRLGANLPANAQMALGCYLSFIPTFQDRRGLDQTSMFFREHANVVRYVTPLLSHQAPVERQNVI